MNLTDAGIVMVDKDLQPSKALTPMSVTDSGIVMLARELHRAKAPTAMVVKDSGRLMPTKELQPSKARPPMNCHRLRDSDALPRTYSLQRRSPQWLSQTEGITTLTTWLYARKARGGIFVREDGMLTWRKPSSSIASLWPLQLRF